MMEISVRDLCVPELAAALAHGVWLRVLAASLGSGCSPTLPAVACGSSAPSPPAPSVAVPLCPLVSLPSPPLPSPPLLLLRLASQRAMQRGCALAGRRSLPLPVTNTHALPGSMPWRSAVSSPAHAPAPSATRTSLAALPPAPRSIASPHPRCLHVPSRAVSAPAHHPAPKSTADSGSWVLVPLSSAPPSDVLRCARDAWQQGQAAGHEWTSAELLVVMRRINDAAQRRRTLEAERAHPWLWRTKQHDMTHNYKQLWNVALPFFAELPQVHEDTERWRLSHTLWRELFVLAVRCRYYQAAANLHAYASQVAQVDICKVRKGVQSLDTTLVDSMWEMFAHAEAVHLPDLPVPGPNAAGLARLEHALSSAPAVIPPHCHPMALLRQIRQLHMQGASYVVSASTLRHVSMIFAHSQRPMHKEGTVKAPNTPDWPICRPFGVAGLEWNPKTRDRESPAHQGLALLESFERHAHALGHQGNWAALTKLMATYLPPLQERAQYTQLPMIRSDVLNVTLFATALSRPDQLVPLVLAVRKLWPHGARNGLGLDSEGWALILRVFALQPFAHDASVVGKMYSDALAATPVSTQLPIISAYLEYLCAHSMETLEQRWARMHQVLVYACSVGTPKQDSFPSSLSDEQPAFPLRPDLLFFSSVIRMLDHLHREQVPVLMPEGVTAPQLTPDSPWWPLSVLFTPMPPQTPSGTSDAPAPPTWQFFADELHAHAQQERGATFLQFNPATNNVLLPLAGLAAGSDAWVKAVCALSVRALKRAVEMQSQ